MTDLWDKPENLQLLRDEWGKGTKAAEIGKMLKCSKNAVVGKAKRLREQAKLADKHNEERFWSRPRKPAATPRKKRKKPSEKTLAPRKACAPQPPTLKTAKNESERVRRLIAEPVRHEVPTAEQVRAEAVRQIMQAADAIR